MDNLITLYQQRLNLQNGMFSRIDHDDAMVAIVYKVTEPNGTQLILRKYYEPFMHKNKPIRALAISFLRTKTSTAESSDFVITCALKVI